LTTLRRVAIVRVLRFVPARLPSSRVVTNRLFIAQNKAKWKCGDFDGISGGSRVTDSQDYPGAGEIDNPSVAEERIGDPSYGIAIKDDDGRDDTSVVLEFDYDVLMPTGW
jgi:hypothetical protein